MTGNERPYQVVHVIGTLGFGGAERTVMQLVRYLDRTVFKQQVLCLYRGGEWAEDLRRESVQVSILDLNPRIVGANWIRVARALRALQPIDVVHAHLPDAWWFALPVARALRIPVRLAHSQNWYPQRGRRFRVLDRVAVQMSRARVLACSEWVAEHWIDEYRLSPHRLTVALNAVEIADYEELEAPLAARAKIGLPRQGQLVLCVASLTEQKGHDFLLDAWVHMARECPTARLLLVGQGPLRPWLEARVHALGVRDSVLFLGARADVPLLMAACDLVVLASRWEGLPLVLAEAAAAGRPVVATDVGGVAEVVDNGRTGLLVPPGDPVALAKSLLCLLGDADARARMGLAARERARRMFRVERLAHEVEDLYLRCLQEGRAKKT